MAEQHKTYSAKAHEVDRQWWVVDAQDQVLGRMATRISTVLQGKHKPTYTPHMDDGDFVIVINADKVKVTGKKAEQKVYYRHTGYPGGIKSTPFSRMIQEHPDRVIKKAVWGMLPHSSLGRKMLKKLKVYSGSEHRHSAQQPQALDL